MSSTDHPSFPRPSAPPRAVRPGSIAPCCGPLATPAGQGLQLMLLQLLLHILPPGNIPIPDSIPAPRSRQSRG